MARAVAVPFHRGACGWLPRDPCDLVLVTYGWGVIPVTVRIGETEWTTSLFPKNGGYLVPIKDVVRRAEGLALGDEPTVALTIEA